MELCYGLFIGGATALLRTPVVLLFVTGPSAQAVVELGALLPRCCLWVPRDSF